MILIVASEADVHARRVVQEIELQGETATVLNWRAAGQGLRASARYGGSSPELVVQTDRDAPAVRLADVRAVWNRRPAGPGDSPQLLDDEHRRFARREWQDLLDGLLLSLELDAYVVSPLAAQRSAVKPYQLAVARRVGLTVPETLITSDPDEAAAFVDAHEGRVVHKAMTSPRNAFVDTRRWQETDRSALHQLPLAPTIFQELVEGPIDIRATIVGDEIYAAAIHTEHSRAGLDSRLDLDVPMTPYELPGDVARRLRALMFELELRFATVDLKLDDTGRLHFLELNPQGQFLYVEILTGQPIAAAMARMLVNADRAAQQTRGEARLFG